jgi:uroporphyrinogen decarboxylase
MLERACDALRDCMRAVREAGCDGVFHSIDGAITLPAKRGIDDATCRTFVPPYESRMAEAMTGTVRVLHVRGSSLTIERVLDRPFEALSVSDRLKGNPTLAELRGLTDRCLMGGIDESSMIEMSLPEVRAQVRDAVAQAGCGRFILSPGCTFPTQTRWYVLKGLRETVETV